MASSAGVALPLRWLGHGSRIRVHALPYLTIAFTLWLVLVPLVFLIMFSFRLGTPWQPGAFTLQHYIAAYSDPQVYLMFLNTSVLALFSTLLSVIIAVCFAFLTERTDMPFRNLAWGLILVPMAVPGILYAISWTLLLSPKIGLMNVWLRSFLSAVGVDITEGPLNIYSLWGMVFVDGIRGVTTVFLIVVGAFRALDPNLEEAAKVSGARAYTTFFRVLIPLLTPAILAAFMYSFMSSLESLEIPMIIGFPAGIYVLSTYIYYAAHRFAPPQYGLSAALGTLFLVVCVILVYGYRRVAGQASRFATITGKGYRPRVISLGRWRYPAFFIFLLYFVLTIAAPTLMLAWRSLIAFYVSPSWSGLAQVSLKNYLVVFSEDKIFHALVNTVFLGASTASLTMLLALVIAWVVVRSSFKRRFWLDSITFLPHSIPGVVIAIALIFLYLNPPFNALNLYGTIWIIVLGLSASYIAFGSRTMNAAVAQLHSELEEAGKVSGAKWATVMRRIIFPLLLPAFISGWIWVASHSLRSFAVPLMLQTRESIVLSVIMWDLWNEGKAGPTAALGILFIIALAVLTVGGRAVVSRLSRQESA
ncbi:MAG: ABC transporter permease [Candidatus Binatia bacterium]